MDFEIEDDYTKFFEENKQKIDEDQIDLNSNILDKNEKEYITQEKLKEKLKANFPSLNENEVRELTKKNPEKLTKSQYDDFFAKLNKTRDGEFQKEAFNILDRDNNGKISPESLFHIFQSLGCYITTEKIYETIKKIKECSGQETEDCNLYFKDFQFVIDKNRARKKALKEEKEKQKEKEKQNDGK